MKWRGWTQWSRGGTGSTLKWSNCFFNTSKITFPQLHILPHLLKHLYPDLDFFNPLIQFPSQLVSFNQPDDAISGLKSSVVLTVVRRWSGSFTNWRVVGSIPSLHHLASSVCDTAVWMWMKANSRGSHDVYVNSTASVFPALVGSFSSPVLHCACSSGNVGSVFSHYYLNSDRLHVYI